MAKQSSQPTDGYVDPSRLYTRRAFLRAAGLGDSTARKARRIGLALPVIRLGRQEYVRGAEGIGWIEAVAAQEVTDCDQGSWIAGKRGEGLQ